MDLSYEDHCAVTGPAWGSILRALLLFDRVWHPVWPDDSVRRAIFFFSDPPLVKSPNIFESPYKIKSDISADDVRNLVYSHMAIARLRNYAHAEEAPSVFESVGPRVVAELYQRAGYNVVPCYDSQEGFERDYSIGKHLTYQAALNNIGIVDPGALTLEQVLQFRSDPEAVRKYRNLRLWLDQGLKAETVSQATEIIAQKLDDYSWAIKKHGLKTLNGLVSEIVDWKVPAALGAATAAGQLLAGPVGAALGAGLVAVGKITVWLVERKIELEDIKHDSHREVAILHDINNTFRPTAGPDT